MQDIEVTSDVYSRLKGSRRPDLIKAVPPVGPDETLWASYVLN